MKLCAVYATNDCIKIIEGDPTPWHEDADPAAAAPVRERTLTLTPREYGGHAVLAVYDQATDTLYIKAPQ